MSAPKRWWLMKTEPDEFSIEDLARDGKTIWSGVRNYQARNFMRDDMGVGDGVLLYHSSCDVPGVAGLGVISARAAPDPTQFDPRSDYHDPASTPEAPRWVAVEVSFDRRFGRPVTLERIRAEPGLEGILVTRKGTRLSIQPVSPEHARVILEMAVAGA
jgi:predicted RNA-binding protein with PUA-like domain